MDCWSEALVCGEVEWVYCPCNGEEPGGFEAVGLRHCEEECAGGRDVLMNGSVLNRLR